MNCPYCGAPLKPGAKFCENCGAPVQQEAPVQQPQQVVPAPDPGAAGGGPICPKCGTVLTVKRKFCVKCGANVSALWESGAPAPQQPRRETAVPAAGRPAQAVVHTQTASRPAQAAGRTQASSRPAKAPASGKTRPHTRVIAAVVALSLLIGITGFWKPGFFVDHGGKGGKGDVAGTTLTGSQTGGGSGSSDGSGSGSGGSGGSGSDVESGTGGGSSSGGGSGAQTLGVYEESDGAETSGAAGFTFDLPAFSKPDTGGGKTEKAALSRENTTATAGGVTVALGPCVLEGDAELSVTRGKTQSGGESGDGWKLETYDIRVGDLHELGTYVEIRIPYDKSYFNAGSDPAKCICAYYYDEKSGEWEFALCDVDTARGEAVISTDHFSHYGIYLVQDEGSRHAKAVSVTFAAARYMNWEKLKDLARDIKDFGIEKTASLAQWGWESMWTVLTKTNDTRGYFQAGLDIASGGSTALEVTADTGALLDKVPRLANVKWAQGLKGKTVDCCQALGYICMAYSYGKLLYEDSKPEGADPMEIASNVVDTAVFGSTYLLTKSATIAALGLASTITVVMAGVLIGSKLISWYATEKYNERIYRVDSAFRWYTEYYNGPIGVGQNHKPWTEKRWKDLITEVFDKHQNDGKNADKNAQAELEKRVRENLEDFFNLDVAYLTFDVVNVMIDDPNYKLMNAKEEIIDRKHDNGGATADSWEEVFPKRWTEKEKDRIISLYMNKLRTKVFPDIIKQYERDKVNKAREGYVKAMKESMKLVNTRITFKFDPEIKRNLKGYTMQFWGMEGQKLNEGGTVTPIVNNSKEGWTFRLKTDEKGRPTTVVKATVLGLMLVGNPSQLAFFKPGDDPLKPGAEPEFIVDFALDSPVTVIHIEGEDLLEDSWVWVETIVNKGLVDPHTQWNSSYGVNYYSQEFENTENRHRVVEKGDYASSGGRYQTVKEEIVTCETPPKTIPGGSTVTLDVSVFSKYTNTQKPSTKWSMAFELSWQQIEKDGEHMTMGSGLENRDNRYFKYPEDYDQKNIYINAKNDNGDTVELSAKASATIPPGREGTERFAIRFNNFPDGETQWVYEWRLAKK